jgi:uncharacterized protein with von Willebrand factor type A (vWA) domain
VNGWENYSGVSRLANDDRYWPVMLDRRLLAFGRYLRSRGLDIHVGRMMDAAEALLHVDIARRDDVYHTLRTLLVHRREDLAVFDEAFDTFWSARAKASPLAGPDRQGTGGSESRALRNAASGDDPSSGDEPQSEGTLTWSPEESLSTKDFAAFTADDIARGRAALDRLVWRPGLRRTRRWIPGRGRRLDLRRALARSLRTGGDVVTIPTLRRRTVPRPLVLLCDVSGSMERYSRMLLHFAHGLVRRHRRVEAFLFSTRLTRITRQLRGRGLDDVAAAVARAVPDWSGGTRIGAALKEFHQQWSRRALYGGPVVLLVSDGWDRGDPLELRDEMARLKRSCRRLVWLNPLIGTADYAPLTQGLQAALPFVDDFLPVRNLGNLADLAVHLNTLDKQA